MSPVRSESKIFDGIAGIGKVYCRASYGVLSAFLAGYSSHTLAPGIFSDREIPSRQRSISGSAMFVYCCIVPYTLRLQVAKLKAAITFLRLTPGPFHLSTHHDHDPAIATLPI